MEGEEKRVKKNWSKEQTMALLEFYRIRQAEFQHSRRKKYAYAHVLDDMISAGFVEPNTTVLHVEVKMASLLRAYKAAKDKSRRKIAAPCVAPFMKQMDEIFGLNSMGSGVKTISCGAVDFEVTVKNEPSFESTEFSILSPSCPDRDKEFLPSIKNSPSNLNDINILPLADISASPAPSISGSNMQSDMRSFKSSQADYFVKRLEQHDRSEIEKSKRWEQYLKIQDEKAERHREKMNKLDSIINLLLKREF